MIKTLLKTLAVMTVLLALAGAPAMAETQLDQEQASRNAHAIISPDGFSQSFTAGKSGKLDKISLLLSCCYTSDGTFRDEAIQVPIHVRVAGAEFIIPGGTRIPSDYQWMDIPLDPAPDVGAD